MKISPPPPDLSQTGQRIAVVIPCYNVQNHIQDVVASIPEYVRDIILVNDCSKDCTADKIASITDPRISSVDLIKNVGVGGAVWAGYEKALQLNADIIIKMDGDGQMDATFLPKLILPIAHNQANYTKGNRFLHNRELTQMPWLRRIGNIGLSFLTKLASGYWNIFDPTNGFTAMDANLIPLLNRNHIAARYFFEISLLCELGLQRAVVQDIYIPAKYGDEKSSLSELKVFLEFPLSSSPV